MIPSHSLTPSISSLSPPSLPYRFIKRRFVTFQKWKSMETRFSTWVRKASTTISMHHPTFGVSFKNLLNLFKTFTCKLFVSLALSNIKTLDGGRDIRSNISQSFHPVNAVASMHKYFGHTMFRPCRRFLSITNFSKQRSPTTTNIDPISKSSIRPTHIPYQYLAIEEIAGLIIFVSLSPFVTEVRRFGKICIQ